MSVDTTNGEEHIVISVVSPFYNEEQIVGTAVTIMLAKLSELDVPWEFIAVNDGSRDKSGEVVAQLCQSHPNLKLVSYDVNRGRGYALRTGIAAARGDIIITTEIDLSWGEDIVERLYTAMKEQPLVDVMVASPHMEGGGYKNVPRQRVFFSEFGNLIIRAFMSNAVTMNTGMTRAYRRDIIQTMPLDQNRKEFHLEVIMKAVAFDYHIAEIPCVLEWKDYKHEGQRVERKSSSKVNKLVLTHTLFSLFANPIRYVWPVAGGSFVLSIAFLIWSFIRLFLEQVSVFTFTISLILAIIALLLFFFGVIVQQGYMVQREIWLLKREARAKELQTQTAVTTTN